MYKPARKRTDYRQGLAGWQGASVSSLAFGGLPVPVQLVDREVLEGLALDLGLLLHDAKTGLEPPGRPPKGVLGVHPELASHVDEGEQQVAKYRLPLLAGWALARFLQHPPDL